jgi:hypothetical protein
VPSPAADSSSSSSTYSSSKGGFIGSDGSRSSTTGASLQGLVSPLDDLTLGQPEELPQQEGDYMQEGAQSEGADGSQGVPVGVQPSSCLQDPSGGSDPTGAGGGGHHTSAAAAAAAGGRSSDITFTLVKGDFAVSQLHSQHPCNCGCVMDATCSCIQLSTSSQAHQFVLRWVMLMVRRHMVQPYPPHTCPPALLLQYNMLHTGGIRIAFSKLNE